MRVSWIFRPGYRSETWPELDGTRLTWQFWFIKQLLTGLSLWWFWGVLYQWREGIRFCLDACGGWLTNAFGDLYYCCLCLNIRNGEKDWDKERLIRPVVTSVWVRTPPKGLAIYLRGHEIIKVIKKKEKHSCDTKLWGFFFRFFSDLCFCLTVPGVFTSASFNMKTMGKWLFGCLLLTTQTLN